MGHPKGRTVKIFIQEHIAYVGLLAWSRRTWVLKTQRVQHWQFTNLISKNMGNIEKDSSDKKYFIIINALIN